MREKAVFFWSRILVSVGEPLNPEVFFVKDVPKTRSGKIMRCVIKAKALGKETGDVLISPRFFITKK
jgi:acyl-coenzyme A synthetase/AMP-(fatty) acid ligase